MNEVIVGREIREVAAGIHQVSDGAVRVDRGAGRIGAVIEPGTEGVPVHNVLVIRICVVSRGDDRVDGLELQYDLAVRAGSLVIHDSPTFVAGRPVVATRVRVGA